MDRPQLHAVRPHLVLTPSGRFRIDRTTDFQLANSLLNYVRGKAPMVLTYGTDRQALQKLMQESMVGHVLISLEAKKAIHNALNSSSSEHPVILQPTPYERFAWINDHSKLTAVSFTREDIKEYMESKDFPFIDKEVPRFIEGQEYVARYRNIAFRSRYKRPRMKLENGETVVVNNTYELRGVNHGIAIRDANGNNFTFRDNALGSYEYPSEAIWKFFKEIPVKTVAEEYPDLYKDNLNMIDDLEFLNGFKCYPGQKDYIARLSCCDFALVAAETGTGKSFIAILLDLLKNTKRTLLIAPKGTIKDGEMDGSALASQWMKEFQNFSPTRKVFKLFSEKDYKRIMDEYGELPTGVYFTYHTVFFNGLEHIPQSWGVQNADEKLRRWLIRHKNVDCAGASGGLGETRNGISCIVEPSLATKIGNSIFDMVVLDEAHLICNPHSGVTRSMLRMQAKHKYALTATPIPNICHNIFTLMGWLAVPNWYQGDVSNPRFPFSYRGGLGEFKGTFLSKEYDITARLEGEYKAPKDCAIISNAPKLLRHIKKVIAFITKADCNPDLVDCNVETVRVPFGKFQKQLYSWNMDLENIPFEDPRTKYGVQMMRLRGICSDPEGREFNKFPGFKMVESNMNPKVVTILTRISEYLQEGEQCIHVSAFQGLNDELEKRLRMAGVTTARIDGTPGLDHSAESTMFKEKKAQVLLMGIKCAQGHSYSNCRYLIIGSLEWSYGSLNQALGRIYRLNSARDAEVTIVLTKDSIEEMMYDRLAQKRDAATIALHGEAVPHEYKETNAQEIFADHFMSFSAQDDNTMNEMECENSWIELQIQLAPKFEPRIGQSSEVIEV